MIKQRSACCKTKSSKRLFTKQFQVEDSTMAVCLRFGPGNVNGEKLSFRRSCARLDLFVNEGQRKNHCRTCYSVRKDQKKISLRQQHEFSTRQSRQSYWKRACNLILLIGTCYPRVLSGFTFLPPQSIPRSISHQNQMRPTEFSSKQPTNNETYSFWEDRLSVMNFNMDLQNLALDEPQKAQDALEIMQDLHHKQVDNPFYVEPDTSSFNTVIDGYAQARQPEMAHKLLVDMERKADEQVDSDASLTPTEQTYLLVAQAWAFDTRDDFAGRSADQAEGILRRMQKRGLEPDVKTWSVVMEGWCKRAGVVRGAMLRAEALLKEMEESTSVRPNVLTYTSFIGGLARSKERDLACRAENTLERMEKHGVQADVVAYTSVLNCWSKAVSRRERELAASRALRILKDMERMYAKEMYHVKPGLITYATAIRAVGNSFDANAPQLAEDVLRRMYDLHRTGTIANLKPTTAIYNAVLHALSRAPGNNRLRYARRAEQLLAEMADRAEAGEKDVQPDVRSWASVLRAWAMRKRDAAENAQRVLDKMEDLHRKGESLVRPNYVCFTTVMRAWGHSRRRDALDKMESLLKRMEDEYEETQEADIRPNSVSYVTAIDAIVRRNEKDAAYRAQATVDRMTRLYAKGLGHVRPTRIIFNTLIHAWSKSQAKGSALKAEKVFQWMEQQYKAGDDLVRPDEVSLCAVLNAWANQADDGGAERAQQIFEHMKSIPFEKRGFHLSIMMPNIVIKAIARSSDPHGVEKAEEILISLEKDYQSGKSSLRPDVTTYSSVINCCAYHRYTEGRSKAMDVAMRTFHKANKSEDDSPNNITYGTLFKAIANLMPPEDEREELVRDLFDKCCKEGVVDAFVLSQIRNASPDLYRDLSEEPCGLGGPNADRRVDAILKNVPAEWCANIVV